MEHFADFPELIGEYEAAASRRAAWLLLCDFLTEYATLTNRPDDSFSCSPTRSSWPIPIPPSFRQTGPSARGALRPRLAKPSFLAN